MPAVQVAIERIGTTDMFRCFYVSADDREEAERLLRAAFPDVGQIRWFGPLSQAAGQALNLRAAEVMEWRIGERIVVSALTSPLGSPDDDAPS